MKKIYFAIFFLSALVLGGCVAAVVEGGHITKDEIVRNQNKAAAERGDKVAQFKLGESYCCSTADSGVAYDTKVAVQWLCLSARQGYAPAMYKIGKIYSGDVIDGLRLTRRVVTGLVESVDGSTVNYPISYAWLKLADSYGEKNAAERLAKVTGSMTENQKRAGEKLAARGLDIPCQMKDVFKWDFEIGDYGDIFQRSLACRFGPRPPRILTD